MRILFLVHAFNSLAQRLFVELEEDGHDLAVELDVNDGLVEEAVALFDPDFVLAAYMKRAIPEPVWRTRRCIVIHPGIPGDRGPSSLDWAILNAEREWGVVALQANGEMDAGPIWAASSFPMRDAAKSSLYRHEVTEAALSCVRHVVRRVSDPGFEPLVQEYSNRAIRGRPRAVMRQPDRAIDWALDSTDVVLRKLRSADGLPGVLDDVRGVPCYLYDAHREGRLHGAPGDVLATRDGAFCRATRDGAVWIGHARHAADAAALKLPATLTLGSALAGVAESTLPLDEPADYPTYRPIRYVERGRVGFLHFDFYNGAMSTAHCEALRRAYAHAASRPTRLIALMGGREFWSNGMHLNVIEASPHPAEESWRNINAMDDLVRDVIVNPRQLTIAAICGNAGAGGVFMALAADRVLGREGAILNPHYKSMGNLYGSEYWTYLLPRRVAPAQAHALVANRLPIGMRQAAAVGLVDECIAGGPDAFAAQVEARAIALANDSGFADVLDAKRDQRAQDESRQPLASYRDSELERMKLNFFGFDSSYHVARYNFVHKVARSRTPLYLAPYRGSR
jgi:putative two-component system hydrogenase maturation factor HypX/HoxX